MIVIPGLTGIENYEQTGELRQADRGERYESNGQVMCSGVKTQGAYPILRKIK